MTSVRPGARTASRHDPCPAPRTPLDRITARVDRSQSSAQPAVDLLGAVAALVDRPDDRATGRGGRRPRRRRRRPRSRRREPRHCRARRARRRAARAAAAPGWRNPIARRTSSAGRDSSVPGQRRKRRRAVVLGPVDPLDRAVRAREMRRRDREVAVAALLQRVRGAQLHRPLRPRASGRRAASRAARRAPRSGSPTLPSRGARSRRSRRPCRRRRSRSRAFRPR